MTTPVSVHNVITHRMTHESLLTRMLILTSDVNNHSDVTHAMIYSNRCRSFKLNINEHLLNNNI